MQQALFLAQQAFGQKEVPVGAVLLKDGKIVAQSHNLCKRQNNPLAHAEFLVIEKALQTLKASDLQECDLYVTLEPCAFCAGAIALVRLKRVFFGAYDPKGGGVDHNAQVFRHSFHKPFVMGGICEKESQSLLQSFFMTKR